jgi:hypothetical protein
MYSKATKANSGKKPTRVSRPRPRRQTLVEEPSYCAWAPTETNAAGTQGAAGAARQVLTLAGRPRKAMKFAESAARTFVMNSPSRVKVT